LRVSPLGLGTVKFGRSEGVKYPTPVRIPDDSEAAGLLDIAREGGMNLIDTAPAYGTAEERLGALLGPHRDHWVICTKVGETFENGMSTFDFSPRAIRSSVERSLLRLRTDRIDIVLLHSDGMIESDLINSGVADALADLKRAGLALAVGASTKTLTGSMLAAKFLDVLMLTLNPLETGELETIERARNRVGASGEPEPAGILIKKAFASGHQASGTHAAGPRDCLELSLGTPGVGSVIVGTTNAEHLRANIAAACEVLT